MRGCSDGRSGESARLPRCGLGGGLACGLDVLVGESEPVRAGDALPVEIAVGALLPERAVERCDGRGASRVGSRARASSPASCLLAIAGEPLPQAAASCRKLPHVGFEERPGQKIAQWTGVTYTII